MQNAGSLIGMPARSARRLGLLNVSVLRLGLRQQRVVERLGVLTLLWTDPIERTCQQRVQRVTGSFTHNQQGLRAIEDRATEVLTLHEPEITASDPLEHAPRSASSQR
jgi:hypothetical protein